MYLASQGQLNVATTSALSLCAKNLEEDTLIEDTGFIIQQCAWVLRITVPANMHHAHGVLAFGMDMIYRAQSPNRLGTRDM